MWTSIIIILAIWILPTESRAQTPQQMYERAISAYETGRYDESIQLLKSIESSVGPNPRVQSFLVHAYMAKNDFVQAKIELEKYKRLRPGTRGSQAHMDVLSKQVEIDARIRDMDASHRSNQQQRRMQMADTAINSTYNTTRNRQVQADIDQNRQRFEARQTDDNFSRAVETGRQQFARREYSAALTSFKNAQTLKPNDTTVRPLIRDTEEELAWIAARSTHSIQSYETYLRSYSDGKYNRQAHGYISSALLHHGELAANANRVQQAEQHLLRFQRDYSHLPELSKSREILCGMYTRAGDNLAAIKQPQSLRSALQMYRNALAQCSNTTTINEKIHRTDRRLTNLTRPDKTFLSFNTDEISTFGLSFGGAWTGHVGVMIMLRANAQLFDHDDDYTIDDEGYIEGTPPANTQFFYTGKTRYINGEGLLGFNYRLFYPIWIYVAGGVAYNALQEQIDEYRGGRVDDTVWIRNTDQSKFEPVVEVGAFLNAGAFHLKSGIKGYDMDRRHFTLGIGISF